MLSRYRVSFTSPEGLGEPRWGEVNWRRDQSNSTRRDDLQRRLHAAGYQPRAACGVRLVQAAAVRIGPEGVGHADHGFGGAQHQHAVRLHHLRKPLEDRQLGREVEIDQDVATEDDVELAEVGEVLQQVQLPMLDHGADVGVDLPELALLGEVFDQKLDRQATLHLELAVDAGLGFLQHLLRQIRRDDLDAPAG